MRSTMIIGVSDKVAHCVCPGPWMMNSAELYDTIRRHDLYALRLRRLLMTPPDAQRHPIA